MAKSGTRYTVEHVPIALADKLARKKGRRQNDGTSLWDWIEADAATVRHFHAELSAALKTAKRLAPQDAFGATRIIEQKAVRRPGFPQREWDDVHFWEVTADTTELGDPDHVFGCCA